jgi:hypothetical protein
MKEVTFTGSLLDVHKQADAWKKANPQAKVVEPVAPIRVGFHDGKDIYKKEDWTLTLHYEEA